VSDTVERVRACIEHSSQKSTRLASFAFQPSKTNVSKVLLSVYLQLYKHQLVQALQPEDVAVRRESKGQNLARADVLTKFHTTQYILLQSFSTFVRPWPGKFFFHKARRKALQDPLSTDVS